MAVVKFRTVSNTVYFKGISDFDNILMFYPAVGGGSTRQTWGLRLRNRNRPTAFHRPECQSESG